MEWEKWTGEQEAELRAAWLAGVSTIEIGNLSNRTPQAVWMKARYIGLPRREVDRDIRNDHWQPEAAAMVTALWAEGFSASKIARKINEAIGTAFTRNAVIGKCQRLKLPPRAKTRAETALHTNIPRAIRKKAKVINLASAAKSKPIEMPDIADAAVPRSQVKTIIEIGNHQCRWAVQEIEGTQFFCAAYVADDGCPYCPTHTLRATTASRRPFVPRPLWRAA